MIVSTLPRFCLLCTAACFGVVIGCTRPHVIAQPPVSTSNSHDAGVIATSPNASEVELLVDDPPTLRGSILGFLPDERAVAVGPNQTLVVVDPESGRTLEELSVVMPDAGVCQFARWGRRPALACQDNGLYRLEDEHRWTLVTRMASPFTPQPCFSDDGVHVAYTEDRCPGEPSPPAVPPRERKQVTCVFSPTNGWRRAPGSSLWGEIVRMHGSQLSVERFSPTFDKIQLESIDAETLQTTLETLPDFRGRFVQWRPLVESSSVHAESGDTLFLAGHLSSPLDGGETAAAGVIAARSPNGTWRVFAATDAPRERWGVRVAFADAKHGVAAGSFYRHVYFTTDGGEHWTQVMGLDPARDARFSQNRLMEDSTVHVTCDLTHTCRIGTRWPDLVIRFHPRP